MTTRPTAPELTGTLFASDFPLHDPEPTYTALREHAPVVWHEDPGVWVLSRYADVSAANRDPVTFSSAKGILTFEIGVDYPSPPTMMHTDPPEHTRLRRAVAAGLRPSRVASLEGRVSELVHDLVGALPVGEPFDVVPALSAPLPLMVICELLGLPPSQWPLFWEWSDAVIPGAAELTEERRAQVHRELEALLRDHVDDRRRHGGDDMVADLVSGAEELSDDEVHILVNQLLIAGNETTRNLISGGLVALAENPEQWEALASHPELVPSAVEELLRWTTPVVAFMRTTTTSVEVGGVQLGADEPVLLLWAAANRDPREFGPTAGELRVDRAPNHHLSFGIGAHFCVGAALARLEARLVLTALSERTQRLELVGDPVRSPSSIIAGLQSAVLRIS